MALPTTAASERLRNDALRIWQAAVAAADSAVAVTRSIQLDAAGLQLAGRTLNPAQIERIIVVGAGKAGTAWLPGSKRRCPKRPSSID